MDAAYWFTWYDVPEGARPEHLDWLHQRYIPRVVEREGVLWGAHYECLDKPPMSGPPGRFRFIDDSAVPRGTRYILCFGATTSRVFFAPTAEEFHDSLGDEDRRQLGLRDGARSSVLVEDVRVEGAEAGRCPEPAPAIQMGSFNAEPDFEDEACAWISRQRVASLKGMEGVVRVRTMAAVSGWARHGMFYEFVSLEARSGRFMNYEKTVPQMAAWTDRVSRRLIHMPGSPAVANRIWPPVETAQQAAGQQGAAR